MTTLGGGSATGEMHTVFLKPGGLWCTAKPTIITTILGSCISICLWDPRNRIGGMNHYVLPESVTENASSRYGDVSIERLIAGMVDLGSQMRDLVAKVFGGAAVLPLGSSADTVGARNLELALRTLRQQRVSVLAHRTGGAKGHLIKFNTYTGDVAVRRIDSTVP